MATGRGGPPSNIIGPVNPYLVNGKLKEDFEAATRRGDDYCKDQLFQEALRLYDEALRIAQSHLNFTRKLLLYIAIKQMSCLLKVNIWKHIQMQRLL